jgi:aminoglycoside phosphotransferase (APT) family kinase protein
MDSTKVRQLVSAQLGDDEWRIAPFGAGKFSSVFAVDSSSGRYVLRVAPPDSVRQLFYEYRMMRQEPAIHARLGSETSVPVPEIVAHDFSRELIDRDYLIMPRLPGRPLSDAALSPPARRRSLREWGGYVAEIHALTDPENRSGYLGEHRCMEPQPTWAEAFAVMYRKEMDDIVDCGVYDRATADAAVALLEEHLDVFDHCDTSCLLHGDLWVTNLLVADDGGVTAVLDFDRACWGDIEWDLAIAEYCGVTGDPFWEGYGRRVETHVGDAAMRRLFYLLYEHQKYIVISMSSRRDDPPRARRYAAESLTAMERFRKTGRPEF